MLASDLIRKVPPLVPYTPQGRRPQAQLDCRWMVEARLIDRPQPGFFKTRLIRGGPWVGAVIYLPCPMAPHDHDIHPDEWCRHLDRSRQLECLVNGKPGDIYRVWSSKPITMAEYLYLTESASWDRKNDKTAPAANPTKAVNLGEMAPIF